MVFSRLPSNRRLDSHPSSRCSFDGTARCEQPNTYYSATNMLVRSDFFYSQPDKDIDIYALLRTISTSPMMRVNGSLVLRPPSLEATIPSSLRRMELSITSAQIPSTMTRGISRAIRSTPILWGSWSLVRGYVWSICTPPASSMPTPVRTGRSIAIATYDSSPT